MFWHGHSKLAFSFKIDQIPLLYLVLDAESEKITLKKTLAELKGKTADIPMYIGNKEVRTDKKVAIIVFYRS